MARPNRIVQLEVEDVVKAGLENGHTQPRILEDLNTELALRHADAPGKPPTVSKAALERYVRALKKETAVALHRPAAAKKQASQAIDLMARLNQRMAKMDEWLAEVEELNLVDKDGNVLGSDWHARISVIAEDRKLIETYAGLLERVYNTVQIRQFQATVMEAIAEADPETAQKITLKLRDRADVVRAQLLGVAA